MIQHFISFALILISVVQTPLLHAAPFQLDKEKTLSVQANQAYQYIANEMQNDPRVGLKISETPDFGISDNKLKQKFIVNLALRISALQSGWSCSNCAQAIQFYPRDRQCVSNRFCCCSILSGLKCSLTESTRKCLVDSGKAALLVASVTSLMGAGCYAPPCCNGSPDSVCSGSTCQLKPEKPCCAPGSCILCNRNEDTALSCCIASVSLLASESIFIPCRFCDNLDPDQEVCGCSLPESNLNVRFPMFLSGSNIESYFVLDPELNFDGLERIGAYLKLLEGRSRNYQRVPKVEDMTRNLDFDLETEGSSQ